MALPCSSASVAAWEDFYRPAPDHQDNVCSKDLIFRYGPGLRLDQRFSVLAVGWSFGLAQP